VTYMRCKAAFLTAPKKFEIREIELPPIEPDQMLVKVAGCGVCLSEMSTYLGTAPLAPYPTRLGHEPAGIVEEVGANVEDYEPGDRVTGFYFTPMIGSFAEYSIVDFKTPQVMEGWKIYPTLVKVPDEIPLEYALGEPFTCTVNIARACEPRFGDYAFIVGCGFMGLSVIAGIAQRGLKELIACDLMDSRLELAKELGATVTLNPKKVDVVKEVMAITNDRGVDVSIEGTGHSPGMQLASKVCKVGQALLVVFGWHMTPETYNFYDWIKGQRIYSAHPPFSNFELQENLERVMWAIEKGIYPAEKLITHKFKLEDIGKAFEMAHSRSDGYIKGVVMP
jgi:threonine dehydrogenase-like Zn-dependent dehydrogenase